MMCSIRVIKKGDSPPFEEGIGAELKGFFIIEEGTEAGKTAVSFHAVVDGIDILVYTTGEIFEGMSSAYKGATERLEDLKKQRNN